jgi:hypothetical protein
VVLPQFSSDKRLVFGPIHFIHTDGANLQVHNHLHILTCCREDGDVPVGWMFLGDLILV